MALVPVSSLEMVIRPVVVDSVWDLAASDLVIEEFLCSCLFCFLDTDFGSGTFFLIWTGGMNCPTKFVAFVLILVV